MLVDEETRSAVPGGDTFTVVDFTIPVRGANDPDAIDPVSFVVEHDAGTFVHAGDSKLADSFADIGLECDTDVGLLAFGTVGRIHHPDERRHLEAPIGRRQLVEADVGSLSEDARTLATLALDARSWYVVRAVTLADKPVGVESIAARIAAAEGIDRAMAYTDLVHVRLPKLADHDLVRYDADRDVVSPTESVASMADAGSELTAAGETLVSEDESIHS